MLQTPLTAEIPDIPGITRVLSDLHLGHDMSTITSVASLRPLIAGASRIIFNGDTLQERAAAFRGRSRAMVGELHALCQSEGAEVIHLRGNHDPTAWPLELADLLSGRVGITHGDVWLRLISPWSSVMPVFRATLESILAEYPPAAQTDLALRFEMLQRCRLALPPSETRQRGHSPTARAALFCREMWPPRRPWEVLKVYARLPYLAENFARTFRPQSQVLIFGHTHRAKIWQRPHRLLINTGAFVTFARSLMVEMRGDTLTVHPVALSHGNWTPQAPTLTHRLRPAK